MWKVKKKRRKERKKENLINPPASIIKDWGYVRWCLHKTWAYEKCKDIMIIVDAPDVTFFHQQPQSKCLVLKTECFVWLVS